MKLNAETISPAQIPSRTSGAYILIYAITNANRKSLQKINLIRRQTDMSELGCWQCLMNLACS